jgi:hypothetical protein
VVLDEAVLHRLIGTPAVMADQLVHVASMAERLHVSVHVLQATGQMRALAGAFDIASVDGTPDTLRTEGVEDQTTESRTLVRKATIFSISPGGMHYRVFLPGLSFWRRRSNRRVGKPSLAQVQLQRERWRQLRRSREQPVGHRGCTRLEEPRRAEAGLHQGRLGRSSSRASSKACSISSRTVEPLSEIVSQVPDLRPRIAAATSISGSGPDPAS